MADSKIPIQVDVVGDAETKLKKIAGAVQDLEKTGNGSFANFGAAAEGAFSLFVGSAVVVGAVGALKKALDLTFEAESVRAIGSQFDLLSKNAGIAGDALKDGLSAAADGLIDDTDLIKIANQAIISMGASATDLPPVMELARKATSVFGGELADNFEKISQAIATGQTRSLKSLGIIIDSDKAYREFAASIGTTADALSDAGKQQAIMNAVLETGQGAFAGVNVDLKQNTDTFQRLKVTLGQIGETATLAFEKLAGPAVQSFLGGLSAMAADAKQALTAAFGEGKEKAQANVDQLTEALQRTKAAIIDLEQKQLKGLDFTPGDTISQLQVLPIHVKKYEEQLAAAKAELEKYTTKQDRATAGHKAATVALIDMSAAQKKLADEGVKIAERLNEKDPAEKYQKDLEAFTAAAEAKRDLGISFEEGKAALEMERDTAIAEKRAKEITDLQARNELLAAVDAERYSSEIAANQAHINAKIAQETGLSNAALKIKKAQVDAEKKKEDERAENFKSSLGTISTLTQSGSAELFRIGQAAAIAQATIDGVAAVQKALTAAPPPFGFALAALVGTASAVNIGKIASAKPPTFADGGIVPGNQTMGDRVPILANSGEVILNSAQQRRLLSVADGERGGGGSSAILEQIRDRLDRLQPQVSVTLDGREVFNSIRRQLDGGRAFA